MTNRTWIRLFAAISTFLFLFDFNRFSFRSGETEQYCWPHWMGCKALPLFEGLPNSYDHTMLFTLIFALILATFWFIAVGREKVFIPLLWALTIIKIFFYYFWYFTRDHNFTYFHILPTLAFLLNSNNRIYGAQIMWALCYSLSAVVKLNESWIVGSYFSSLKLGMPLAPDLLIPLICLAVILVEIFGGWALLSSKLGKVFFAVWTSFHLYSAILVGYFYPTRCIANLWILFGPKLFGKIGLAEINHNKKLNPGLWILLFFIVGLQMMPLVYSENSMQTMRWEGYGFNMFDSNHQCHVNLTVQVPNKPQHINSYKPQSMHRCSPRTYYLKAQELCKSTGLPISMRFAKSINGGPFYRLVNENNICNKNLSLLFENEWINTKNPPIIGYPKPNYIAGPDYVEENQILSETPVLIQTQLQTFLSHHFKLIKGALLFFWISSILFILIQHLREVNYSSNVKVQDKMDTH